MITVIVVGLFAITTVLVGLRFFNKKDPFGDLSEQKKGDRQSEPSDHR